MHSGTSHLPSCPPHHSLPLIPIPLPARVWAQLNFVEMVMTERRPWLLPLLYTFVEPFSVDEHTPGMPTASIPFAVVWNRAPKPWVKLFIFGSDLIKVYHVDFFVKIIVCTCVHPCPLVCPPLRADGFVILARRMEILLDCRAVFAIR